MNRLVAQDLATLLKAGMSNEFEKRLRKHLTESAGCEGLLCLVDMINEELSNVSQLKVQVTSEVEPGKSYVSISGQSRLFGDSWVLRRQVFSI